MTILKKSYTHKFDLKYGINPHQKPARIFSLENDNLPFSILNGRPSYTNILDAINAWFLVKELDESIKLPAATSFKHVSPAGAAFGLDLDETLLKVYDSQNIEISPMASAYIRARGTDPLASYGDFIGLSREVDLCTAKIIKKNVSDGIIAPEFEDESLKILKEKKGGEYVILKVNPKYRSPKMELRELNGVVLSQNRNDVEISKESILKKIVTNKFNFPSDSCRDLLLATISLKYTQSNSVIFALNGQTIGIGAGQQSRLDSVKIAGNKAKTWFLRQHPTILNLPFKEKVGSVGRINAIKLLIEEDLTEIEIKNFQKMFNNELPKFSTEEKKEWIAKLTNVSLSSDAFFPFRDSIDYFAKVGVKYVVQPGGSKRDDEVISASNEYGIAMAFSGIRLFHH